MRVPVVGRLHERHRVQRPASTIAAWFLTLPCGELHLTLNEALLQQPGAPEWAEAWFRLNALARGRPFGVLHVDDLEPFAPFVVGHQHDPLV